MKKNFTPKKYLLILLITSLIFSSCEIQCDEFNRQSALLTIALFPEGRTHYEFESTDNTNLETLRLTKQSFEFSERYEINTFGNDDEDCYSSHLTFYSFDNLPFSLENELAYDFFDSDPYGTFLRYWLIDNDNQIIDGVSYDLPYDNPSILRDIDNLTEDELNVIGTIFNDVLTVNLAAVNMVLLVEQNRGLQGIIYDGKLYTRVN